LSQCVTSLRWQGCCNDERFQGFGRISQVLSTDSADDLPGPGRSLESIFFQGIRLGAIPSKPAP
jgi:hypothetical protein